MNIIAAPRRGAKPGRTPAERPRGVDPAPLPIGHTSARSVLAELRMTDPRGQQLAQRQPKPAPLAPWPGLMLASGATHAACILADTIIDDLSDLAENVVDLLPRLERAYADHFTHLMLLPAVARLVELFGTETGTEAAK